MAQTIRKRSEIDDKYKWQLEDVYPSDKAWEADCDAVTKAVTEYAKLDGHVADDPRYAIRQYFELYDRVEVIGQYAFLRRETDNSDATAQAMVDRAASIQVNASAQASFLQPELLAMDDAVLQDMMADPDMADFSEFLRGLLRSKPHQLPKEQERLLAMTGEMQRTPNNIYSMLTNVDMKFPDIKLEHGETMQLSDSLLSLYTHSDNREVRRQAYEGIMKTYGSFGDTIAATYAASVKCDQFSAAVRHFPSAVEASLFEDEIPLSVYDNLISVIHESLPVLKEYMLLRKTVLGVDELHMYDLYCPMVSDYKMELSYDKAYDLVLEGLAPMGGDYIAKLREARDNGWIDVYPCENKSSGAFSMGLRHVHPYVLLNHNDNLDSAMTIAHEMGHSMHTYFSNMAQPNPKADYSLFVAEVASTCNEAVMMRTLLEKLPDKKAQAYLLNHFLEQFRTTCFRQTMFAEFERISHDMAARGEALTKEALNKAYFALNETYYGSVCKVDDYMANEWMRIPHFYRAFYVFVYATGLCAAVSLSDRIITEGESAVKDYRKFLSAGSSVPPIEALKLAGIDMSSPEPIRKAMAIFADTLKRFKQLMLEEKE